MSGDGATPLPRGRHGLSREEVRHSQRERVLRAMAEVMAERGYAATAVADVLKLAGVSRSTFYELFSSKDDCFMSAVELAVGMVLGSSMAPGPVDAAAPADPVDRFAAGLHAYLGAIADNPALARVFLVEVYAAGPEAARRRAGVVEAYAEGIAAVLRAEGDEDRFAVRALVASIMMLVTLRIVEGDAEGVRALHAPLVAYARRVVAT